MSTQGSMAPAGSVTHKRLRPDHQLAAARWPDATKLRSIIVHGLPRPGLGRLPDGTSVWAWRLRNLPNLWRGARRVLAAKVFQVPTHVGGLYLDYLCADGRVIPLGLASLRVVTDTGVGFIVDAFQNSVEMENMKFHGYGTGVTAEAASQTALVTELTTEYATDNTRPTGSTTEGAANIYRTVATLDPDADVVLREHGVFSQAATGGGVMIDRTLFAAVSLTGATGDAVQTTYDLTFTSGG